MKSQSLIFQIICIFSLLFTCKLNSKPYYQQFTNLNHRISKLNSESDTLPTLILDSIYGKKYDSVSITLSLKNFENVTFIIFRIDFDPSILELIDYESIYNDDYNIAEIYNGIIYFDYPVVNIDNSEKMQLLKFNFRIKGNVGDCSPIIISNAYPVSEDGEDLFANVENGQVCVNPPDGLFVNTRYCVFSPDSLSPGTLFYRVFNGIPPYIYEIKDGDMNVLDTGVLNYENVENKFDSVFNFSNYLRGLL